MIEPSKAELIRQIEREGKRWGLSHMISSYGEVLVAEEVPCKINLGNGVSVVENVKQGITKMSTSYPFSSVLRSRLKRTDKIKWMGLELRHAEEKKLHEQKMEAVHHEFKQDLRKAIRGRLLFGGK
jgi:hypothetical protein